MHAGENKTDITGGKRSSLIKARKIMIWYPLQLNFEKKEVRENSFKQVRNRTAILITGAMFVKRGVPLKNVAVQTFTKKMNNFLNFR